MVLCELMLYDDDDDASFYARFLFFTTLLVLFLSFTRESGGSVSLNIYVKGNETNRSELTTDDFTVFFVLPCEYGLTWQVVVCRG